MPRVQPRKPVRISVKCGIRIQLLRIRQHMQDCGGGSSACMHVCVSASAGTSSVYAPDRLDFN